MNLSVAAVPCKHGKIVAAMTKHVFCPSLEPIDSENVVVGRVEIHCQVLVPLQRRHLRFGQAGRADVALRSIPSFSFLDCVAINRIPWR